MPRPDAFDLAAVRAHFPALAGARVFLDNPRGTQIAREALDAVNAYYLENNANLGGAFATSVASDRLLAATRAALADFLGAAAPEEIVFGPNMTTLTFAVAHALGRLLRPGDELVVTH